VVTVTCFLLFILIFFSFKNEYAYIKCEDADVFKKVIRKKANLWMLMPFFIL